mgnify:CR=1 FL=1
MGEYRRGRKLLQGRGKMVLDPIGVRIGPWGKGVGLADSGDGGGVITLWQYYNLEHVEEAGDRLEIDFRIYPEGHVYYHVAVDPFARTFTYKGKVYSTDDFRKVIEADRVGMGIKA